MAQRFTVFDVLESKGAFKKNPANLSATDDGGQPIYAGPVLYPKMLYHPEGKERIIQEGEYINTPLGPKQIMQQRELIWEIANNPAEEKELLAAGWHTHPAEAMRAAGKEAPNTGADHVIAELKRKIAELEAQKTSLEVATPAPAPAPVSVSPRNPLSK